MVEPGWIGSKTDNGKSDAFTDILKRAGKDSIEVQTQVKQSEQNKKFAFQSWGAHFVEVKIDPALPRVQVSRVVSVMNCGRIVTAKPARSQIMGGVVMGIGMALMEETVYDEKTDCQRRAIWPTTTCRPISTYRRLMCSLSVSPTLNSIRSAAEVWAKSGSPEPPPRLGTQFIMRPANESATFR
jgi:xanthine dehydrogenase molybdopterin-binding subunit B